MTASLDEALRAAAAGIHPDEAGTELIISHGVYLKRPDFTRHIETASGISDGTPMAWIDWDAVITALDSGGLPSSAGEKRILRIAASLAAGRPVNLREAIPGLDQRNQHLVVTAVRRAAGDRSVRFALAPQDAAELGQLLRFVGDWLAAAPGSVSESFAHFVGADGYDINSLRDDIAGFTFLLGEGDPDELVDPAPPTSV